MFCNLLQDSMLPIKLYKVSGNIKLPKSSTDANTGSYQAFNIQVFLNPQPPHEFKPPE